MTTHPDERGEQTSGRVAGGRRPRPTIAWSPVPMHATGFVCCVEVRDAVRIHLRIGHPAWQESAFQDWAVGSSQPFHLTIGDLTMPLDPCVGDDIDRAHLAPLLRLTRRGAGEPRWDVDGRVVVPLESGSLVFPPHPTEESWTVTGPWGQEWRCLAGGVVLDPSGAPLAGLEDGDERPMRAFAGS